MINTQNVYENPSLGRIGEMYHDERNERVKFFSTDIHSDKGSIDLFVDKGIIMMESNHATRMTARFFCKGDLDYNNHREAIIPLTGRFAGIDLVFIGFNVWDRIEDPKTLEAEDHLVIQARCGLQREQRGVSSEYIIERLDISKITPDDFCSLERLYAEAFETYTTTLDRAAISDMISNSVVYGVRSLSDDQIVSTAVAEIGVVPTERGDFRICELSEMATRRDHRGRGLVTMATMVLVDEIYNDTDLIYAEARACHLPINRSFHNMGFSYAGRLMKQCLLSGDHEIDESGPYENLNVWYIT